MKPKKNEEGIYNNILPEEKKIDGTARP